MTDNDLPVVPPLPADQPNLDPNPPVAKCGECGLIWHRVMFYSCGNPRCPMQTRISC